MTANDFVLGLNALGYDVERVQAGFTIPYNVPLGRLDGRGLHLGFQVGDDWPLNPPSGPHVSEHVLPFNSASTPHPHGGVHASAFGPGWQYWSRPFRPDVGWANTDRSVRTYMRFIDNLFATI